MTRRNTLGRWLPAGLLAAAVGCTIPANVNAFQTDGPFPSRLEDALQPPAKQSRLQSNQRSGTVYRTSKLSPEPTTTTPDRAEDLSWFGTVMTFPATSESNTQGNRESSVNRLSPQTPRGVDQNAKPLLSDRSQRSTAPFRLASSGLPTDPKLVDNSPLEKSRAAANALASKTNSPSTSRSVLTINSILTTSLTGSPILANGTEADFQIEIKNPSDYLANDIIVQLTLPTGLMISNLDRQAWLDEQARTISWRVVSLAPGASETIQYRVKSLSLGMQVQKIAVGMNDQFQSIVEHQTEITAGD